MLRQRTGWLNQPPMIALARCGRRTYVAAGEADKRATLGPMEEPTIRHPSAGTSGARATNGLGPRKHARGPGAGARARLSARFPARSGLFPGCGQPLRHRPVDDGGLRHGDRASAAGSRQDDDPPCAARATVCPRASHFFVMRLRNPAPGRRRQGPRGDYPHPTPLPPGATPGRGPRPRSGVIRVATTHQVRGGLSSAP